MPRKIPAVLLFVILSLIVIFTWYQYEANDPLTLNPKPDDIFRYQLRLQKTVTPADEASSPSSISFEMYSRAEIISANETSVTVKTQLEDFVLKGNNRLTIDSQTLDKTDVSQQHLASLLRAGVTQKFDNSGAIISSEFNDKNALRYLSEQMSQEQLELIKKCIGQINVFNTGFPNSSLSTGLSWTSSANSQSPSFSYTVDAFNDDAVSMKISQKTKTNDSADVGYLMTDRHSGLPLSMSLHYARQRSENDDAATEAFDVEYRRLDQAKFADSRELENRIYFALFGTDVDRSDENYDRFFLPPFGAKSSEYVLSQLNDELVWVPPGDSDKKHGLKFSRKLLLENSVEPIRLNHLRLVKADGSELKKAPDINPAFDFSTLTENTDRGRSQSNSALFAEPLSESQIRSLERIELNVDVNVLGQLREGHIAKNSGDVKLGNDLTVSVDSWSSTEVTLRLTKKDGYTVSDWTFLAATPEDEDGDAIKQYEIKSSHTAIENIIEEKHLGPPSQSDAFFTSVVSALRRESPLVKQGDILMTVKTSTPISALNLSIAPFTSVNQTWIAMNTGFSMKGTEVVGERTVDDANFPNVQYESIDITEATIEGVEHHQLMVNIPNGNRSRCEINLDGPATYQGQPYSLSKRGYDADLQLLTDNGIQFFYGLDLKLAMSCATRIDTVTEDIDNSNWLTRVDENTVALTSEAEKQLKRLSKLTSLPLVVIGRRADGRALKRLDNPDNTDTLQFRFWGKVETLSLPRITENQRRIFTVNFAPLP